MDMHKDELVDQFKRFLVFCAKELELEKIPSITWTAGDEGEKHTFGSFHNEDQAIKVSIRRRHPLDIMRTLAHELCHYRQWLRKELNDQSGETGSPQENEANAMAGIIMRKWNQANQEMFAQAPLMESEEGKPAVIRLRGFNNSPDSPGYDPQGKAKRWINRVHAEFPANPLSPEKHYMAFEDHAVAMFELTPSVSKPGAVEIKWFQAHPMRSGAGTKAMQKLQAMAAEDGVTLTLYPWDSSPLTQSKLIDFYKRMGFKLLKDGSKNMIWEPVKDLAESDDRIVINILNDLDAGYMYDFLSSLSYAVFREKDVVALHMESLLRGIEDNKAKIIKYMIRKVKDESISPEDTNFMLGPPITALKQLGISWSELDVIRKSIELDDLNESPIFEKKLTHQDPVEVWIRTFKQSTNPKFRGKTPEQRERMARAAQQRAVQNKKMFEVKTRLDPKCWKGYRKQGTKIKNGVRVNNCVPKESMLESGFDQEAGIGIDGRTFKFKIRDLVKHAEKYPVTKIDPSQFKDQLAGRDEDPAQAAARAEKAELKYPIIVVKRPNGELWIADGTHRVQKAIMNDLPSIDAKIIPIDDMEPFRVNVDEAWSKKYKRSIDCSHPKGFSQKAHCAGRKARRAGKKTRSKSVSEAIDPISNRVVFPHKVITKRDDLRKVEPGSEAGVNVDIRRKRPRDPDEFVYKKPFPKKDAGKGFSMDESVGISPDVDEFLNSLTPDDVGVEQIGPYKVHFEGFNDWCKQDAEERCNLSPSDPRHLPSYDAVYDEALADFIKREGGKQPIATGMVGDVLYAVFDDQQALSENDQVGDAIKNVVDSFKNNYVFDAIEYALESGTTVKNSVTLKLIFDANMPKIAKLIFDEFRSGSIDEVTLSRIRDMLETLEIDLPNTSMPSLLYDGSHIIMRALSKLVNDDGITDAICIMDELAEWGLDHLSIDDLIDVEDPEAKKHVIRELLRLAKAGDQSYARRVIKHLKNIHVNWPELDVIERSFAADLKESFSREDKVKKASESFEDGDIRDALDHALESGLTVDDNAELKALFDFNMYQVIQNMTDLVAEGAIDALEGLRESLSILHVKVQDSAMQEVMPELQYLLRDMFDAGDNIEAVGAMIELAQWGIGIGNLIDLTDKDTKKQLIRCSIDLVKEGAEQKAKDLIDLLHKNSIDWPELAAIESRLNKLDENFADGKGPGKPGDSQRHGIPKNATIAQLEKHAKRPGRAGQLARWQLNMRRGKAKK